MKVLIKIGGTLLDEPGKREAMARQLAWTARQCELVAVHGGGKQVTRFLEERGIASEFIGGLRVSDLAVVDAVTRVIAGGVNKQFVSALIAADCNAVGLSGVDGGLVEARPLSEELKFTGQPSAAKGQLLDLLIGGGYVPVVACIAGDKQGNIYNVNADQLAVSCAVGWHADKLFFLTDVPGVRDAAGEVIAHVDPAGVRELIRSGVAGGGMQAKLRSCVWALENGLSEVVIASGQAPDVCSQLLSGARAGTSLTLRSREGV